MNAEVLAARISGYSPGDALEQENVLQEIMQHYVLASLSRAGFFRDAVFHGGTFLRVFHGMSRFSEDLDFFLKRPDPGFRWQAYLEAICGDFAREGMEVEAQDKPSSGTAVRKAFLKTDAIGRALRVQLPFERRNPRKIRIKLEVDTNPPGGSTFQTSFVTFPQVAAVTTQTLPSGFGTKSHALLCRRYVKGRDWYDFIWYTSRRIVPNLELLRSALYQQGPWAGQPVEVTPEWLLQRLAEAIARVDWEDAARDVRRFLPAGEQASLDSWGRGLFTQQLEQMRHFMLGS